MSRKDLPKASLFFSKGEFALAWTGREGLWSFVEYGRMIKIVEGKEAVFSCRKS